MPHVTIRMYPGRSARQKAQIAEAVAKAVMASAHCAASSVSVGIEDVAPGDWLETVYRPEIEAKPGNIYKPPGYDPRDL